MTEAAAQAERGQLTVTLGLLWRDKIVTAAVGFLLLVLVCALIGPWLLADAANAMNLRARNMAPFSLEQGWLYVFGTDALGRSMLARLVVAAQYTVAIAAAAVTVSLIVGGTLGLVAGYLGGVVGNLIMRGADVLMSFPSLLMAMIVLYVFEPGITKVVLVLALTRLPVYMRTTRAEVLEIRERVFVAAAKVMGAGSFHIMRRHVAPLVLPTLLTIAALEFAFVMLAESALSFLGIGIQPPDITWGLMVAQGRNYLNSAWWLAFFPGLAIMLTTLSMTLVANWLRAVGDPVQRAKLTGQR